MYKCDYADERCIRNGKDGYCEHKYRCCNGNGYIPPDIMCEEVSKKDMCKESSRYGNYYIGLTAEQIEQLQIGKVLGVLGQEYNIFIEKSEVKESEDE